MIKLKAKRSKSSYKNTNAWLDAVYRNNKSYIDSKLVATSPRSSPKTIFKQLVREYQDEGFSPTRAVNILSKSTIFTPERERLISNAWSGLRGDKEAFKEFRRLAGWKTKIRPELLKWDKVNKVYTYNNITIRFDKSPAQVVIGLAE